MTWPDAFVIAAIALCITGFAAWREWLRHKRIGPELFDKTQAALQERAWREGSP